MISLELSVDSMSVLLSFVSISVYFCKILSIEVRVGHSSAVMSRHRQNLFSRQNGEDTVLCCRSQQLA